MGVESSVSHNIGPYSVQEDATPVFPNSYPGVGATSFTAYDETCLIRVNREDERRNLVLDPEVRTIHWSDTFDDFVFGTRTWDDDHSLDFNAPSPGLVVTANQADDQGVFVWSRPTKYYPDTWSGFTGLSSPGYPQPPSTTYTLSFKVTSSLVSAGAMVVPAQAKYNISPGYYFGVYGTPVALVDGGTVEVTYTFTTPASPASYWAPGFGFTDYQDGDVFTVTEVMLEETSTPGEFFSGGSRPEGRESEWDEAANASTSSSWTPIPVYGDPMFLFGGENFSLTDSERGTFHGFISDVSRDSTGMSYNAYNYFSLLNVEGTVLPTIGLFGDFIMSIFTSAGLRKNVSIDAQVYNLEGQWMGFKGNLWNGLNDVLLLTDTEIYIGSDDKIVVQERGSRSVTSDRDISFRESASGGTSAVTHIDLNWRQVLPFVEDAELYSPNQSGYTEGVLSVEAGETQEFDIQLNSSVLSVNQPTCVSFVESDPGYYDGTNGVYSVAGSDGLPVPPEQWNAQGGSLYVHTTDDPSVVRVVVTGGSDTSLSPYRIAMTSGNYYNSLRITGNGIRFENKTLRFPTGADPRLTSSKDPQTFDTPYVTTLSGAIRVGSLAAENSSGRSFMASIVSGDFTAEFGVTPGSLLRGDDLVWRISSATLSQSDTSISAVPYTSAGDFEDQWVGKTAGDLENAWDGLTDKEFWLRPLRGA